MTEKPAPRTPAGLGTAGRRLWRQLVKDSNLEFRPDELLIIAEAAHVADVIASLRDGLDVSADPKAVREVRLQQESLRKLLRSLDIPDDAEGAGSWDGLSASQRGRRAALARWRRGG